MAALLSKFRIGYSDLVVLSDLDAQPEECTKSWFDDLIRNFERRNNPWGMAYQTDSYRQFSSFLQKLNIRHKDWKNGARETEWRL